MRTPALLVAMTALSRITLADDDVFQLGVIEINGESGQHQPSNKETISDEDIARHNRNDVASALNLLPGVSVQNLGARNERLIYIRGFNSRQVPLFMDGIPVYVPYDGNVDLNRFTTFDIAQIDVSKGNASVLYGPNTLGGSINLVSRQPTKELEANLKLGTGMDSAFDTKAAGDSEIQQTFMKRSHDDDADAEQQAQQLERVWRAEIEGRYRKAEQLLAQGEH